MRMRSPVLQRSGVTFMKTCLAALGALGVVVLVANAPALGAEAQRQGGPMISGSETGFGIFQNNCTACHGNPNVPAAPSPAAIRGMPPERIYQALTTGVMQVQGQSLSDLAKRRVAESMAGRLLGTSESGAARNMPNQCKSHPAFDPAPDAPAWNGWGANIHNTRYQPGDEAGLTVSDVPKLKLKWAFGYPNGVSALAPANDRRRARLRRHRYGICLLARCRYGLRLLVVQDGVQCPCRRDDRTRSPAMTA